MNLHYLKDNIKRIKKSQYEKIFLYQICDKVITSRIINNSQKSIIKKIPSQTTWAKYLNKHLTKNYNNGKYAHKIINITG